MKFLDEIKKLKKHKKAIILAHNYQTLDVQEVADFVGDSLQLSQEAARVEAEIIVFCGVRFMAETAKLLKPNAKVLLSSKNAGCPMADMITGEQLREFKKQYNNPIVVCYVNSTVEVKAESDICCTSGNAIKIINSIPQEKTILFVPDQNLGTFSAQKTGRNVIVWDGYCNVHHHFITKDNVIKIRKEYPDYALLVHPECKPEVFNQADLVCSTKGMADYVKEHDKVIIGTEVGLFEQLKAKFPEKKLVPLSEKAICINMKKTTLNDVYLTLKNENNEIILDDDIMKNAVKSIDRMLELS
ncbi:MAG: quinolinate synthase NadA [Candidatus Cloacimonetes bacterium]|nr:quinolinate synthase NadA [Candidatus Cloacimonadota bacterium]